MLDTYMEEDIDFNPVDNLDYEEQTEDNEELVARYVTVMSRMRALETTEEAIEVDQGLVEELQVSDNEEDFEQERNGGQSYKAPKKKSKTKKTCRKYTREQVVEFCCLSQVGWPTKATTNKTGITLQTAYRYAKYYNEHQEVPDVWKPRGPPKAQVLGEAHQLFIRDLIDRRSPFTLEYMREVLMQ